MSTDSLGPRLREKPVTWSRRDGSALLLFVVAVVVMTYPLAFRPAEGLPMAGLDVLTAHWQGWWISKVVKNGLNPNFTPYLFHPNGLDLTFQPHPWAALFPWQLLKPLLGDIAAFNVSALLGLLASAYIAYLLIRYLTDNRVAAWVGGAFYAFYPLHLIRAFRQPNTGTTQWLPLFMLALVVGLRGVAAGSGQPRRGLSRRDLLAMVLAALALALNAYISVKPWIQAALLGALYVPLAALAGGWWRGAAFWKALGVLAICSLLFALPVISPYLLAGSGLQHATEQQAGDLATKGSDLAAFVRAAPKLPLFMPRSLARLLDMPSSQWDGNSFYLGLTSIVLAVLGLIDSVRRDRQRVVWLVMALVFWGLSLGTVLHIDKVRYPDVWTPYRLVEENPLFQAARVPRRFALAFSLPWAVLVGYGVAYLWRRLEGRKWLARGLVGGLSVLMLFELAEVPISLVPREVSPFYQQLRAEGEQGAIIDLPMGRANSKRYMYLQTIHHRPIVEGAIARMPKGAYSYINANPLLWAWKRKKPPACDYDVGQAIDDLQADGFRYVVVHHSDNIPLPDNLAEYFTTSPTYYHDQTLTVFTLDDLQVEPPCARQ